MNSMLFFILSAGMMQAHMSTRVLLSVRAYGIIDFFQLRCAFGIFLHWVGEAHLFVNVGIFYEMFAPLNIFIACGLVV